MLRDDCGESIIERARQSMCEAGAVAVAHSIDAVEVEAELRFEVVEQGADKTHIVIAASGFTGAAASALSGTGVVIFPLRVYAKRPFRSW